MQRRDLLKYLTLSLATIPMVDLSAKYKSSDIVLPNSQKRIFKGIKNKLNKIKKTIGYSNFSIIHFDQMLRIAKQYRRIEPFSKAEISFMESIFYDDPKELGFYGRKTCRNITDRIKSSDIHKIPHTGQYLYKGKSTKIFYRMKKDIGETLILTSGVRSIIKQMYLYLNKIDSCNGNMTLASRSIAPPSYSYHSIGDFDIGKKGFGYANFTKKFARTKEFYEIMKLKYVEVRYTINNNDGVRYEPWHVKIV